jgi:1,2-phenylacetyl-CoA epoxidase PaaB subunit
MNIVFHITNGWYDFTKLDQSKNYIKVNSLNCGTNKKAIKQARNILHNKKANITIKEVLLNG